VPIEVDTAEAPALLRLRLADPVPSVDEIAAVREQLMAAGSLDENTVSLIDVRDVTRPITDAGFLRLAKLLISERSPRRRAILMNPGLHLRLMQLFQSIAPPTSAMAGFLDERVALEWLLNPEGRAAFKK
jgi:hypothetical protein